MERTTTFKKRNRVPSSCSVCRKRKSKCDRARPVCGLCKKKSIAHLCYYESGDKGSSSESSRGSKPADQPKISVPHPQSAQPPPHSINADIINQPLPPQDHSSYYDVPHNGGIFPAANQPMMQDPILNHPASLAPPPTAPPTTAGIPLPEPAAQQSFPSEEYNGSYRPSSKSQKESAPASLVQVSIGPNSTIQINPKDTVEEFFSNASFPLSLEGQFISNHGAFSYVGLTKSDRFVKIFRRFAVELLRNGEISQFVSKMKRKKDSTMSSPGSKRPKSSKSSLSSRTSPTNMNSAYSSVNSHNDSFQSPEVVQSEPMVSAQSQHEQNPDDDPPDVILEGDEDFGTPQVEVEVEDDEDDEDGEEDEHKEAQGNDEEDILVITKINVAKEKLPKRLGYGEDEKPLSILPGLKALYSGSSHPVRKEYYKLVEKAIMRILPCQKNLFILFCRFFKWTHPFIPIINESVFFGEIQQIVEGFPGFKASKHVSITIKNDRHLLLLAQLLLITRLSYLSLIQNHTTEDSYTEDEVAILNEAKLVTVKDFTDVINLCIPDEHTSHRSSFKMLRTLTLLYFYRQVAPNDCHGVGGADSQILFGTIVRHAFSIGLNRDPSKYVDHDKISKNEDLHQSWRYLWNYLVNQDANTAIQRGSVLDIHDVHVGDVQMPDIPDKTGKLVELYRLNLQISEAYRRLSKIFSNHQEKPRIVDILKETNELEHLFLKYFGKDFFKHYICCPASPDDAEIRSKDHEESYLKVMKYVMFINLRTNLTTIYYVIAIHYEIVYNKVKTKSMSAGIELFKIHFKSVVQLVYIMSFVFDNSVDLFGKNYDYILTAANERCMIKTHCFLTSFFIRLIHQKQQLTMQMFEQHKNMDRLEAINSLFNMILVEAELFVGNFRKLSLRYVNSYKIYVLSYYVLKQCMENSEVFFLYAFAEKEALNNATNMLRFFSASEINYLCKLCEEFRVAKDIQTRQKRRTDSLGDSSPPVVEQTQKPRGETPLNINQLNPMKDFTGNLFRMHRESASPAITESSYFPQVHGMADPNDPNIQNEEFLRLFELYGDSSINLNLE